MSKSFPLLGFAVVQNFRKVEDTGKGLETYVRGECVDYHTKEKVYDNYRVSG